MSEDFQAVGLAVQVWPGRVCGGAAAVAVGATGGGGNIVDICGISQEDLFELCTGSKCLPMGRPSQSGGSGRVNDEVVDPARRRDFVSRPIR